MPRQFRSAWWKTLGQLVLMLAVAFLVGLAVGEPGLLVTLVALAFVLALAWLFLRLLKRATSPRTADGQAPWQVVQAVPLGGRERLVVVRRGAHEYVLGVTASSVSLIDKQSTGGGQLARDNAAKSPLE